MLSISVKSLANLYNFSHCNQHFPFSFTNHDKHDYETWFSNLYKSFLRFAIAPCKAPNIWNNPPFTVHNSLSISNFKRCPKSFYLDLWSLVIEHEVISTLFTRTMIGLKFILVFSKVSLHMFVFYSILKKEWPKNYHLMT